MAEFHEHLPQLRAEDAVYFITWRLENPDDELSAAERSLVVETLELFKEERYRLAGYVVMDDHVHVMVCPLSGSELGRILHSWKSYTASAINKMRGVKGTRWQKDSFTEIMRNEREIRTRLQYILDNPGERWPDLLQYSWVRVFPVL